MTDSSSPARAEFERWCELPHTRLARATRRKQWGPFLAGWIASQGPRLAAPAPAAAPELEGEAAFRRCDTNLVDVGGECLVCDAAQGEACQQPDPRKNPRKGVDKVAKHLAAVGKIING